MQVMPSAVTVAPRAWRVISPTPSPQPSAPRIRRLSVFLHMPAPAKICRSEYSGTITEMPEIRERDLAGVAR